MKHGTSYSYRCGCRCTECVEYNRKYFEEYKKRYFTRNNKYKHGTLSKYNFGCRCEFCKEVRKNYNKDWNKRRKENAKSQ